MSYEYDENNGLQPKPPKKNNNDLGSWIFIAVMFAVAWPVGLILLLSKLSEGGGGYSGRVVPGAAGGLL